MIPRHQLLCEYKWSLVFLCGPAANLNHPVTLSAGEAESVTEQMNETNVNECGIQRTLTNIQEIFDRSLKEKINRCNFKKKKHSAELWEKWVENNKWGISKNPRKRIRIKEEVNWHKDIQKTQGWNTFTEFQRREKGKYKQENILSVTGILAYWTSAKIFRRCIVYCAWVQ